MPDQEKDRKRRFAIENHLGSGWLFLRDDVKIQRSFTATLERHPETDLCLKLDVEVDKAGNPHCRGVRLHPDPDSPTFDDSITTARWRRINLTTLLWQAFRDALDPVQDLTEPGDDERVFATDPSFSMSELDSIAPRGVLRSKARKPLAADELRAVAKFYERAAAAGRNPTKDLADHFGVHRSTARRWVQRAEDEGYLSERLTPADGARRSRQQR